MTWLSKNGRTGQETPLQSTTQHCRSQEAFAGCFKTSQVHPVANCPLKLINKLNYSFPSASAKPGTFSHLTGRTNRRFTRHKEQPGRLSSLMSWEHTSVCDHCQLRSVLPTPRSRFNKLSPADSPSAPAAGTSPLCAGCKSHCRQINSRLIRFLCLPQRG